jgi:hypothetical protein
MHVTVSVCGSCAARTGTHGNQEWLHTVERLCLVAITVSLNKESNEDMYVCDYFVISSWKDPKCPFRTDKRLQLRSVPTLMLWGQPKKVEETECSNPDLVSLFFGLP